jgi:inosine-uridine nucleoside N-ribohydrolase
LTIVAQILRLEMISWQAAFLVRSLSFGSLFSMSANSRIILDTDPGGDDCFALLWLQSLAHQGLTEIVAVTTAQGNVNAELTFRSASKILKLGGFETVEIGRAVCSENSAIADASYIHGADGMGNLSHTLADAPQTWESARPADDLLIEKLSAAPKAITIAAIAPLTNLATAEQKSPGILKLAKEIVIMGGAFQVPGNVTSEAEFNIAFDPEAAQIVLNSGANLVLIPLDVTRQVIFTPEMLHLIHSPIGNPVYDFLVALCQFMVSTALQYRETQGVPGFLVHDAATIAYLFYPEVLMFQRAQVWVETQGEWTRGKTILDRRHGAKAIANAWLATSVDWVNLLAVLTEDLNDLWKNS